MDKDNKVKFENTPFGPISVADEDFFGGSMNPEMAKADSPEESSRERKDVVSENIGKSKKSGVDKKTEMHRQEFDLDLENERRARVCAALMNMSRRQWYQYIVMEGIRNTIGKVALFK